MSKQDAFSQIKYYETRIAEYKRLVLLISDKYPDAKFSVLQEWIDERNCFTFSSESYNYKTFTISHHSVPCIFRILFFCEIPKQGCIWKI